MLTYIVCQSIAHGSSAIKKRSVLVFYPFKIVSHSRHISFICQFFPWLQFLFLGKFSELLLPKYHSIFLTSVWYLVFTMSCSLWILVVLIWSWVESVALCFFSVKLSKLYFSTIVIFLCSNHPNIKITSFCQWWILSFW